MLQFQISELSIHCGLGQRTDPTGEKEKLADGWMVCKRQGGFLGKPELGAERFRCSSVNYWLCSWQFSSLAYFSHL